MNARISLMYKRSGGAVPEHECKDCTSCKKSPERKREFMCERHGESNSNWNPSWVACRYWTDGNQKQKNRKPRTKKPKLNEEVTGQLQMVFK